MPAPARAAAEAKRRLAALGRPLGAFDPARYFRAETTIRFHNVTTRTIRALAREIDAANRTDWGIAGALAFADALIRSEWLDEKALGLFVLARHRREFTPRLLPVWKRWLARGDAANWATTDSICGYLIGPLLVREPSLAPAVASWTAHRGLWVRRAAAVALIKPVALRAAPVDLAYRVASDLAADPHDLIHKAVGWLLREAGKVDRRRLERYVRERRTKMPRTTVRYALERFPEPLRRRLLSASKAPPRGPGSARRARLRSA